MDRLELIRKLKRDGKTLKQIGEALRPQISSERVRQLLNPEKVGTCKKHKQKIIKKYGCVYCQIEQTYEKFLENISSYTDNAIRAEFLRLSKQDRSKKVILQKITLIRFLKDVRKMGYTEISRYLNRDFSTIKYLYNKKI